MLESQIRYTCNFSFHVGKKFWLSFMIFYSNPYVLYPSKEQRLCHVGYEH